MLGPPPHRGSPLLRRCVVLSLALCMAWPALAQSDSTALYKKIERVSKKHKVTRWLYDAIFIPPSRIADTLAPMRPKRRLDPYAKYAGRMVRRVDVHVLDPFGYSIDDTAHAPTNWFERVGNSLHRSTRSRVITDLMLVEPGDTLSSLAISESERVLRTSPGVNDARISVRPLTGQHDSVDLVVMVLDKWSIGVDTDLDLSSGNLALEDHNFLGLGHELQQGVFYSPDSSEIGLFGRHAIFNIGRSHVSFSLSYSTSGSADALGFSLDRPFYSPLAKWGGGLAINQSWNLLRYAVPDSTGPAVFRLRPFSVDTWFGWSFPLVRERSFEGQSSNIVLGARYVVTRFADRPPEAFDAVRQYHGSQLYLFSIGLSLRQYYKERYLFRFGLNEDVPEGLFIGATTGFRRQEFSGDQPYFGAEIVHAHNTDHFGYLSTSLAYGTYVDDGMASESILRAEVMYFTDPLRVGKWNLRQFVRAHAVVGFAQPSYARITFAGAELFGLDSDPLGGTRKLVLNLETVAYAPYDFFGFRFAPVLRIGFGTLGEEHDGLLAGRIFSAFGAGLLVRNENLLFKTFELSIGYFPLQPGGGSNFQVNPYNNVDLRARDLAFTRPAVVPFD